MAEEPKSDSQVLDAPENMIKSVRSIEFFAGIGGFSIASPQFIETVAAIEVNQLAAATFQANLPHPLFIRTIEALDAPWLEALHAEFWWMSPPCQPFTRRGSQRDLNDPRTLPFKHLVQLIPRLRPTYFAMENVPGFRQSKMRVELVRVLLNSGYQFTEWDLCPTHFGIPNRRRRYYLVARRGSDPISAELPKPLPLHPIHRFISRARGSQHASSDRAKLGVPQKWIDQYSQAIDIVDVEDTEAVCNCFTSAYGRSPVRSGSYLRDRDHVRFLGPDEILALLGFPTTFQFPTILNLHQQWRLVGNSLSIPVLRFVLERLFIQTWC